MALLRRIDRILDWLLSAAVVLLSVAVTGAMLYEVLGRYVFSMSILGMQEIVLIGVMWLYMCGVSLASRRGEHLRIELLDHYLRGERAKAVQQFVVAVLTVVILAFVLRWAYGMVEWAMMRPRTTPALGLPWLASQISILGASVLLFIYGLRDVVKATSRLAAALRT